MKDNKIKKSLRQPLRQEIYQKMSDSMESATSWPAISKLINQVGILLVRLNEQLQTNMVTYVIQLTHTNFQYERKRKWSLHFLFKETH
eukprot:6545046-Ditylum_brightwellii.AAC.1